MIEQFLLELKEYWIKNDVPNISITNAKFIRDLLKIKKPKNMLEIWTANWFSWINFALELQKFDWVLTTIEFSKLSYDIALQNFEKAWVSQSINPINWNALDEIPKLQNNFDFVFIDANHTSKALNHYFELIIPKITEKSVVVIDDINWSNDMWKAWEQIRKHPQVVSSLDIFGFGILFFNTEQNKMHYKLIF